MPKVPAGYRMKKGGGVELVADVTETLTCKSCGKDWTRDKARGRKPVTCPTCAEIPKVEKAKKADALPPNNRPRKTPAHEAWDNVITAAALAEAERLHRETQDDDVLPDNLAYHGVDPVTGYHRFSSGDDWVITTVTPVARYPKR